MHAQESLALYPTVKRDNAGAHDLWQTNLVIRSPLELTDSNNFYISEGGELCHRSLRYLDRSYAGGKSTLLFWFKEGFFRIHQHFAFLKDAPADLVLSYKFTTKPQQRSTESPIAYSGFPIITFLVKISIRVRPIFTTWRTRKYVWEFSIWLTWWPMMCLVFLKSSSNEFTSYSSWLKETLFCHVDCCSLRIALSRLNIVLGVLWHLRLYWLYRLFLLTTFPHFAGSQSRPQLFQHQNRSHCIRFVSCEW